eukprot:2450831-Rhodomonas_salina.1
MSKWGSIFKRVASTLSSDVEAMLRTVLKCAIPLPGGALGGGEEEPIAPGDNPSRHAVLSCAVLCCDELCCAVLCCARAVRCPGLTSASVPAAFAAKMAGRVKRQTETLGFFKGRP